MPDLSPQDVAALGRAAGLELQEPHLTQVTHSLNALLESLRDIDDVVDLAELDRVQPLPIIVPPEGG